MTEDKPYCEYTFGQFMCGERVDKWGQFCPKHTPTPEKEVEV